VINGSTGLRVLGRWSLLEDCCGKYLGLLVNVDLDLTDELSERRYVTSLSKFIMHYATGWPLEDSVVVDSK
jgi:hypothetical protein